MNLTDSSLWAYFTYFGQQRYTHWEDGSNTDGVAFGVAYLPDGTQLVGFEGSHDALDWWRNFKVCVMVHPRLGGVDAGLYDGIPGALPKLKSYLDKDRAVIIDGHSRGGSNAIYVAGELLLDGYNVATRVLNPPRTQHQRSQVLSGIFKDKDIIIARVNGDPVSLEPPQYTHPVEPQIFTVAAVSLDPALDMKYHHIQLCIVGALLQERGLI